MHMLHVFHLVPTGSLQGWLCTMVNTTDNGSQSSLMLEVLRAVRPEVLQSLNMDTTMPLLVEAAGNGDAAMVQVGEWYH